MLLLLFTVLAYLLLWALASDDCPVYQYPIELQEKQKTSAASYGTSLEDWLQEEQDVAFARLLANIAPGQNTEGVPNGTIVASPSKKAPDYFYQWTRDAAITALTLTRIASSDPGSLSSLEILNFLEYYASLQSRLQHQSNPSGTFADLSGLGEPKFNADGSAYEGSWGRPQRDGPALRALALITYLRLYNHTYPSLWAGEFGKGWYSDLYEPSMPADSVIKADLEYVSHYWRDAGFDLWEEMRGLHFFTAMVQKRALTEGAEIAGAFGDVGAQEWYKKQANAMERFVEGFWSKEEGHLVATLDTRRSGLDCGVVLGALHGTHSGVSKARFPPWSDEVLVSMLRLIEDQQMRFPVNAAAAASNDPLAGTAVGRYPEDVYDGYGTSIGHPWFLCTASVAEILYRTTVKLAAQGWLEITPVGLEFWGALNPDDIHNTGTIVAGLAEFNRTLRRLREVGDDFLAIVKQHADAEGSLSEQFDRVTGFESGAPDLTWSYGALLEALDWRKKALKAAA
ncbi:MAG: Glucoamylase, intracellular sporulation-specific [Candelina submexicana]|nr:MAG: Glucoamylase, intracellular sporulation-specific [Candelina submexicana]